MAARNLHELAQSTVDAIVASPSVGIYNVGITMSPDRRRRQYALYSTPRPWNHMVFLAYDLTAKQAVALEKHLFTYCAKGEATTARQQKYSRVKEVEYRSSVGGLVDGGLKNYSVYVAWCEPGRKRKLRQVEEAM